MRTACTRERCACGVDPSRSGPTCDPKTPRPMPTTSPDAVAVIAVGATLSDRVARPARRRPAASAIPGRLLVLRKRIVTATSPAPNAWAPTIWPAVRAGQRCSLAWSGRSREVTGSRHPAATMVSTSRVRSSGSRKEMLRPSAARLRRARSAGSMASSHRCRPRISSTTSMIRKVTLFRRDALARPIHAMATPARGAPSKPGRFKHHLSGAAPLQREAAGPAKFHGEVSRICPS